MSGKTFLTILAIIIILPEAWAVKPQGLILKEPRCWYTANPGPCEDFTKVWGYDYLTNRCIFFLYGGCGGNPNRFYTKQDCLDTCRVYKSPNRIKRQEQEEYDDLEEFEKDIDYWDKWENDEL